MFDISGSPPASPGLAHGKKNRLSGWYVVCYANPPGLVVNPQLSGIDN